MPHQASIVGVSGGDTASLDASPRWQQCLHRTSSRVPEDLVRAKAGPHVAGYRGDPGGFHQDESCLVLVDGIVENLQEVCDQEAGDGGPPAESDAGKVAFLYARLGDALFPLLTGSFSLVIAIASTGEVLLVRDRFGSRPLFYGVRGTGLAWASEMKCIAPLMDPIELDREGLRQAIHYRYVLGDTMLRNISQVLPACYVHFQEGSAPVERRYWTLVFKASGREDELESWVDRVDSALDAYMRRLASRRQDVCILLSGGVDSSLLALKARGAGFSRCVALTARWPGDNPELDEAIKVARHLGLEHHIVDVDVSRFDALLPWIVWRIEELPRHFNSLILACLFEYAIKVGDTVLHGHAADAMFGPQEAISTAIFNRRRRALKVIPRPLRQLLASLLPRDGSVRTRRLSSYLTLEEHGYLKSLFAIRYGGAGYPIKDMQSRSRGPSARVLENFYDERDAMIGRLQRLDMYTFNQSHFPVFDRLSTPLGLTVATPYLAHEIVQIAQELPPEFKAVGGQAKPVLKRLMARSFPAEMVYRRKQGFPTDVTSWLKGPLARKRRILTEERTQSRGLLSATTSPASEVMPHFEGVWTSLCLEIFCRQFLDGDGGPALPSA